MKTITSQTPMLRIVSITSILLFASISVISCKPKTSEPQVSQTSVPSANSSAPTTPPSNMQGVVLTEGWAKATVAGQKASGGYLRIRAVQALRLVGASSPVAQTVEVHEMRMEGDVMRMRALEFLDIPTNTTVELAPGGNHLMLLGLKQALPAGSSVPITLRFTTQEGKPLEVTTTLEVRNPADGQHSNHDKHEHAH